VAHKKKDVGEKPELQMTPMIDVTFLLLIFFLCSIRFRLLDGKLSAYLPRDRGVNVSDLRKDLERIEIGLARSEGEPALCAINVNGRRVSGLKGLYRKIRDLLVAAPDLEVVCRTGRGIRYNHVVQAVNECLRAGITRITFAAPG